jgi:hypothetical protein
VARHKTRTWIVVNGWLMAGICVMAAASANAQQSAVRLPERSVVRSRGGGAAVSAPANSVPANSAQGSSANGGWSSSGGSRMAPAVPPTRLPNSRLGESRSAASSMANTGANTRANTSAGAAPNRIYMGPAAGRASGGVPGGMARSGPVGSAPMGTSPAASRSEGSGPTVSGPQTRRESALPDAPPEEVFAEDQEAEAYAGPPVPPGYVVEMDEPYEQLAGPYDEVTAETYYDGSAYSMDGWFGGHARGHHRHGGVRCTTCNGMGCPECWFGGYGLLNGLYLRGEFLRWQSSGMHVPALVTTNTNANTPPVTQAGVLGANGTKVLYGDQEILGDTVSGGRFYAGLPLDYDQRLILEGEYFSLEEVADSFSQSSGGTPILARPFFNLLNSPNNIPGESSELVAYPGVVRGTVGVEASSTFQGAAARLRYLLCCSEGCVPSLIGRRGEVQGGYRMELTGGYRYLKLQDNLRISEELTSTSPTGTFDMFDSFATDNQFHGVELGMLLQTRRGRWTMDLLSRVGIGSTSATSTIAGQTSINDATPVAGALLAQSSNIGTFDTSDFALTPELGLTLGFDLTPRFRLLAGYSMIYWSRVLRAGDQIDREVNPNLIPPAVTPLVGPLRPDQNFVWSDFWAQGVSVGLEGHW